MKAKIITPLLTEQLVFHRFVRLVAPFKFFSGVLNRIVEIPEGFVCDKESVPIVRGRSPESGVGHDYFCRYDSDPVVTKQVAAKIYKELQWARDVKLAEFESYIGAKGFKGIFMKIGRFLKQAYRPVSRVVKTAVVMVAWGYFHKHSVKADLGDLI